MITYDLRQPGRNYTPLYEAIKTAGYSCVHPLESVWLVASNSTAQAIRDQLQSQIDSNDALLVSGLTGEAAWTGISQSNEVLRWYQNN